MTQLALQLEPKPASGFEAFQQATDEAKQEVSKLLLPCSLIGEASSVAGALVSESCRPRPRELVDRLMDGLDLAARRAEEELQRLREMHAELLGCPVEELDQRLAAEKAEEDRLRQEARASQPARVSKGRAAKGGDAIGIGRAALSVRQRELLAHIKVENNLAVYTSQERIDDWDLLKRVMVALGGNWKTGGKKTPGGFRFPDDVDAAELVRLAKETGEITDPKAAELFETPLPLGAVAVERLELQPGMRVLEPSAGRGALVRALILAQSRLHIEAMEAVDENIAGKLAALLSDRANDLRLTGVFNVVHGDFTLAEPGRTWSEPFDRILMNPPFSKRQDIQHVRHAYKFLAPGGVLVAIMSAGVKYRDDKLGREFRDFVKLHEGCIWDNPERSFAESGTDVRTVMVRIRRTG